MNNQEKKDLESESNNLQEEIIEKLTEPNEMESNKDAENIKEEECTISEYLSSMNKEFLVMEKFEKNEELKKCSYEKGYITQEIYICKTCNSEKNSFAGMCIACAYKCHANHEIENLHFKRNFRCDCGNSNFFASCDLQQEKDFKNDNKYNHNFSLKYCYCEGEDVGTMIQCMICEDWFHSDCLTTEGKFELNEYEENKHLICNKCLSGKMNFLKEYENLANFIMIKEEKKEDLQENNPGILNDLPQKEDLDYYSSQESKLLGKKRKYSSSGIEVEESIKQKEKAINNTNPSNNTDNQKDDYENKNPKLNEGSENIGENKSIERNFICPLKIIKSTNKIII